MSVNSLPTVLQPAIQQNYLLHAFDKALQSNFKFRSAAVREIFPNGEGETVTRTRPALLAPVASSTNAGSSNTNFDNGMSVVQYGVEQYTATLTLIKNTMDLNIDTSGVAVVDLFVQNGETLAKNAAQSMDRQAQIALYNAALYGNTRVRVTATTPYTTISLDDIRGFQNTWVNGVPTTVSGSNTLAVTLNGNAYTVTAASADGTNVSSVAAFGGISGTITLSAAATPADVTVTSGVGTAALSYYATTVLRPNARSNTSALAAGDILTLGNCLDATTALRNNATDGMEGDSYVIFLSPTSMRQIFKDPDFKQLYQGDAEKSSVFPNAMIYKLAGLIFVSTTDVTPQVLNGVIVQRPLVVAKGALIEMIAEGMFKDAPDNIDGVSYAVDGVKMVVRPALDRLGQIVAQSYFSIFAYVCPTDVSVLASVIPTASTAAYKRIVLLEHASS